MAKILDTNLYGIEELISMWKSGWRNLAKLDCAIKNARHVGFVLWHDIPSENFYFGLHEIIQCFDVLPLKFDPHVLVDMLFIFAAAGKRGRLEKVFNSHSYDDHLDTARKQYLPLGYGREPTANEQAKMRKIENRVLTAFTTSCDFAELLSKIATKANQKIFVKYLYNHPAWEYHPPRWSEKQILSFKIERHVKKAMQCLKNVLNNVMSFEEAWWGCVWFLAEPTIKKMLKIKESIDADIPLGDEQIQLLNDSVNKGSPCIRILSDDDNKKAVKVMLDVRDLEVGEMYLRQMADALLTQPAFVLAQELQQKCIEPRFVAQCRAPSCRKSFYTQRENAVVCPSKTPGKTSGCRLEWFRYMRYLRNLGKDPTKDWNNPKLIEYYLQHIR